LAIGSSDINYRRFFDVNTLAGLRVEDPARSTPYIVVKKLIAEDSLQGLRSTTSTALRDPALFFSACAA